MDGPAEISKNPTDFDWSKYPDEGLVESLKNALLEEQTKLQETTGKTHGIKLKGGTRVVIPDQEPFKFTPKKVEGGEKIAIALDEVLIIRRETRRGEISLYFSIKDRIESARGGSRIMAHKYDSGQNCFKLLVAPDTPMSELEAMRAELRSLYWANWNSENYRRMAELEQALGSQTTSFSYLSLKPGENLGIQWQKIIDVDELGIIPRQIVENLLCCTATRPFIILTGSRP